MGGRLLVPYQYVLYRLLLKNRIVNMQGSAAGVAEDVFHTFVLERANKASPPDSNSTTIPQSAREP